MSLFGEDWSYFEVTLEPGRHGRPRLKIKRPVELGYKTVPLPDRLAYAIQDYAQDARNSAFEDIGRAIDKVIGRA